MVLRQQAGTACLNGLSDDNMSELTPQLDLFHVHEAYSSSNGPLTNAELYAKVQRAAGLSDEQMACTQPVGKDKAPRSVLKRQIRWHQQTLKSMGVIKHSDQGRGVWELTEPAGKDLDKALPHVQLVAYSTKLGAAIWGDCKATFKQINEPVHLCVTSPPYPLRVQRSYGNVPEREWVDFICESLEPIVEKLVAGGSVVLNVSNDIHVPKSPARSTYLERMVIALEDRLGLSLMDRWVWSNPSKPPAPTYWACVNRQQLCTGYEPIFWFSNDPAKVRSDNRRVLMPHSDAHKALMAAGGEKRTTNYADGAYRLSPGDFGVETTGKIPKNVFTRGSACSDSRKMHQIARDNDLPRHPAMYPTDVAKFAIEFLTEPGDLVVDPFSGANKTGLACERTNRRWLTTENIFQYIRLQALMFSSMPGFSTNIH